MKLALILTLFSLSAFADVTTYNVQLDLSRNGKTIVTPSLMTKQGEKATVRKTTETGEVTLEVTAEPVKKPSKKDRREVKLNFSVTSLSLDAQQKLKTEVVKKSVVVGEEEFMEVKLPTKSKTEVLTIKVVAKTSSVQPN